MTYESPFESKNARKSRLREERIADWLDEQRRTVEAEREAFGFELDLLGESVGHDAAERIKNLIKAMMRTAL